MANKRKHSHRRSIQGSQRAILKALYPGMIVNFDYRGKNVYDKSPLILLLYNENNPSGYIHGLNLNYLTEKEVQRLFCSCELLFKGANVYSKQPIDRVIQSGMDDFNDTKPYRNLLKEDFTRIMLPTFREERGGRLLSSTEAKQQMKVLYEKVIKKILTVHDIYRIYKKPKLKQITVLQYKLGDWHQPKLQ